MKSKSTRIKKSPTKTSGEKNPGKMIEEYRKKHGAALRKAKITIEEIIEWKNERRR